MSSSALPQSPTPPKLLFVYPNKIYGLKFTVVKAPTFSTIVQKSPSGASTRIAQRRNPVWEFTLTYEQLFNDLTNPAYGDSELNTLMGFYMLQQGQLGEFLFDDPEDDVVTNQPLQLVSDSSNSPVLAATIGTSAGTGFAVNDQLAVVGGGGSGAVLQVSSIGAGGAITGFTVAAGGAGYVTTTGLSLTVLTGSGTGSPTANISAMPQWFSPLQRQLSALGFFEDISDLNPNVAFTVNVNGAAPPSGSFALSASPGLSVPGNSFAGLYLKWTKWTQGNYALGALLIDPAGHLQKVTTAGSSGSTPPTFNDSVLPPTPSLSQVAGGTIAATTYFVKITYTGPSGETLPSAEANFDVSANELLQVASPAALAGYTGYNVYVSTATGAETKQNASPIAIGTNWTEPTTGLIAGSAPPSSATTTDGTVVWTDQGVPTITASFGFYFRVRFAEDTQDFEKFLQHLYTIGGAEGRLGKGSVKLESVRVPADGSDAGVNMTLPASVTDATTRPGKKMAILLPTQPFEVGVLDSHVFQGLLIVDLPGGGGFHVASGPGGISLFRGLNSSSVDAGLGTVSDHVFTYQLPEGVTAAQVTEVWAVIAAVHSNLLNAAVAFYTANFGLGSDVHFGADFYLLNTANGDPSATADEYSVIDVRKIAPQAGRYTDPTAAAAALGLFELRASLESTLWQILSSRWGGNMFVIIWYTP